MQFAFDPIPTPSLAIQGSDLRYPVRRIFCVGRNYADHALEMGGDPNREPPFFFTKPADAILESGSEMTYPKLTEKLHHELELVIAIGKGGDNISKDKAREHIFGYAIGIDMTRRDLQDEAKQTRRPWDSGKAFDQSAPCGPITPADQLAHPDDLQISLTVNGDVRQSSSTNRLIWTIDEIIEHLSHSFTLAPGDLIYSGTPAGVGPLIPGDHVVATAEGLETLEITITG